ncbi:unnamed protein product [Orchesella dallaii]|uniref:Uncharacterized protein n=1 Tax=Orchesella dallaii TaxID=48710 RepID=A0ABP1RJ46_9HEXA
MERNKENSKQAKKLSTSKVEELIHSYAIRLPCDKLKNIFDSLQAADGKKVKLPKELKNDVLKVEKYSAVPSNLINIVVLKLKEVICERAALGTMIADDDKENTEFIDNLQESQKEDLEKAERIQEKCLESSKLTSKFAQYILANMKLSWTKSPEIILETWEGTQFFLVRQNVMVLSQIIPLIEAKLSSIANLMSVHFVAKEVIYIDCNLDNSIWHGITLILISKRIECISNEAELIWDLSGTKGKDAPATRALDGTPENVHGENGSDGENGENGGNIILIAENFKNLSNIIFKSFGGVGGNGQEGGNGKDGTNGENGAEFNESILREDFPSPAKQSTSESSANRKTLLTSLSEKYGAQIHENESNGVDIKTGKTKGVNCSYKLSGILENGIEFDVGYNRTMALSQGYCLMKGGRGTLASPRGAGGAGGLGGLAGKAGSVQALHFDKTSFPQESLTINLKEGQQGIDGVAGEDGKPARNGKNGNDVGYVDNKWWRAGVYFNEKGRYELTFFDKEEESSVWCSHREKWVSISSTDQKEKPGFNVDLADLNLRNENYTSNPKTLSVTTRNSNMSMETAAETGWSEYAYKMYLQQVNSEGFDELVGGNNAEWWMKNMFQQEII